MDVNVNNQPPTEPVVAPSAEPVAEPQLQKTTGDSVEKSYNFLYYILGILEVLLAFRFVLKLLGANPNSGFASFIYGLSGVFVSPFRAIFRRATSDGVETTGIFEPETLIAMVVYALLFYGVVKLLLILSSRQKKTP